MAAAFCTLQGFLGFLGSWDAHFEARGVRIEKGGVGVCIIYTDMFFSLFRIGRSRVVA